MKQGVLPLSLAAVMLAFALGCDATPSMPTTDPGDGDGDGDGDSAGDGDGDGDGDGQMHDAGREPAGDAAADMESDAASTPVDASAPDGSEPSDDASTPAADITAARAAAEMGKGVNLGQMFDNTQHAPTFDNARAKVDAYYAKGFRSVRIPVTWTEPVDGTRLVFDENVGEVNREHPRLAALTQVIDHALSLPGMYVVLNAHHERALKTHSRAAVLERLWQDISDIFGDRDHHLLFEILNEPHREDESKSPMPAADLREMTGMAYRKIRAVDEQRIVLIGGNQWFHYTEMAKVWPHLDDVGGGNDPYVMATFHHYNPWTFCGDNQGDYADTWASSDIANPMDVMDDWKDSVGKGMPVYIGEWGVGWGSRFQEMDCNNIRLWYQMFHHDIATPKQMPTAVWDDGGWFKIFDHGSNTFDNNLVDCISGSCDWTTGEQRNSACF